jgi:hypothetical protein
MDLIFLVFFPYFESDDIPTISRGISGTLYIFRAAMMGKGPPFFAGGVDIYKNISIFILLNEGPCPCPLFYDLRFDLRFGACVGTQTHGNAVPISSPAQLITSTK